MNLFYHPDCQDSSVLSMEESKHLHVLRKKVGDEIRIVDGKGFFYDVVLTAFTKNQFEYAIKSTHQEAKRDYRIHLAIAPTKNIDRTEWLVEKCIEIGIDQIILYQGEDQFFFVYCSHRYLYILFNPSNVNKYIQIRQICRKDFHLPSPILVNETGLCFSVEEIG